VKRPFTTGALVGASAAVGLVGLFVRGWTPRQAPPYTKGVVRELGAFSAVVGFDADGFPLAIDDEVLLVRPDSD
jgi:hypothetical protein